MTDETRPTTSREGVTPGDQPTDPVSSGSPTPHELGIELPADPDAATDVLLRALAESQEEASSYLTDLKRVAADFDNYRKRAMREQKVMLDRAAERVIEKLLPALDSFDAAISIEVNSEAGKQLMSGMLGTRDQLLSALADEGLQVIPTVGEDFNPEIHEPLGAPAGGGHLVVSGEFRRGYRLGDRVIRAALVTLESTDA